MAGFHFVANLKPYTWRRGRGVRRFDAYLLSTDYVGAFRDLARAASVRAVLCADNGNLDLIRSLVKRFDGEAVVLRMQAEAERRARKQYLRPGDASSALRDACQGLARRIASEARAAVSANGVEHTLAAQRAMSPKYLIGMEDVTIGVLNGLGIDQHLHQLGDDFHVPLIDRATGYATGASAGRDGGGSPLVFAGLQAHDLDGARLAGRRAADAGVDGIAIGLAGALQDASYSDYRIDGGEVVELGGPVPRPYVRVAELAAGLHEGYAAVSGARPRFHALGAGTPILIPLLAALGDGITYTATDSTSPIVDGWSGPTISLYVDNPAPLKYKAARIAEAWIADGKPWGCRCPYCRRFEELLPPRVDVARAWWASEGKPSITKAMLERQGPLAAWLPLLGHSPDAGIRLAAAMARVGHNHWILHRLETAARSYASVDRVTAWARGRVDAYLASEAAPAWRAAVGAAWSIVERAAERLHDARPTPLAR